MIKIFIIVLCSLWMNADGTTSCYCGPAPQTKTEARSAPVRKQGVRPRSVLLR